MQDAFSQEGMGGHILPKKSTRLNKKFSFHFLVVFFGVSMEIHIYIYIDEILFFWFFGFLLVYIIRHTVPHYMTL